MSVQDPNTFINPLTGRPLVTQDAQQQHIAQYYPEYDPNGGVRTSVTSDNGGRAPITISHRGSTPETHPWLYINPGQVDTNGKIYDSAPVQTGTGIRAGRQASPEEIAASTAANNYFQNGGQGLDPRLMQGMSNNSFSSNQYQNPYGTYTRQHAIIDPARQAAGLDPWVEMRSRFSGVDQQGNPLDYQNERSIWGNRGPGGGFGNFTQGLYGGSVARALRNPSVGGGSSGGGGGGQPPSSTPPGTLPGGPPSGGPVGESKYIGLPPGHSQFGGPGKPPPGTPEWWKDMMARMPGNPGAFLGNG